MVGPVAEDGAAPSRIMIKFDSGMVSYPIAAAICAASIFASAPPAQSAQAAASAWSDSWGTSVRLISAGRRVGDEDTLDLGGLVVIYLSPLGFLVVGVAVEALAGTLRELTFARPLRLSPFRAFGNLLSFEFRGEGSHLD